MWTARFTNPERAGQLALDLGLRERASFDSFWAGDDAEAWSLARRFARGEESGSLYLHGGPGSGKSHLLYAACRLVGENAGRAALLPMREMGALSPALADGLGGLDLVCIDDLQAMAGNPEWERALFGLYREIEGSATRVIACGTGPLTAVALELRDLRSRIRRGLVVRVRGLDERGRIHVLRTRARDRGIDLSDEVLEYLLRRGRRDMHALLALLDELDRASLVEQRRVTIPLVRRVLGRRSPDEPG